MINLSGKVALVTGGSRGIGRACALRLAEAGADVAINYVSSDAQAHETAERIRALGRRAAAIKADVSENQDVASMMEFLKNEMGRLDILVSNAASGGFRPLLETTEPQFHAAMNLNVRATLSLVQAGLPLLQASGGKARVIAISSQGAHRPLPYYGLIGSSKAALESMMQHLALEAGPLGIRFNVVEAGLVETDSSSALLQVLRAARPADARHPPAALQPGDVANAVLYLASELSEGMQGQTLVIGQPGQFAV